MDAIEVDAEVVGEELAFRGELAPAVITANFEDVGAWIEGQIAPYRDMDPDAIDMREAKASRAHVNRVIKTVEDSRREIKRAFTAPLDEFEARVKALLEPAREAVSLIDCSIKAREAADRERRAGAVAELYEAYAPALMGVVPVERITDPKWLNATGWKETADGLSNARVERELAARVEKIATEWESLKTQEGGRFYEEAEAEFFRTLSLAMALNLIRDREAEQARIDALRADVAQRRADQEPEQEPEPEPEPETPAGQTALAPHGVEFSEVEPERSTYVVTIDLSDGEREELMGFLRRSGIGANRRIRRA